LTRQRADGPVTRVVRWALTGVAVDQGPRRWLTRSTGCGGGAGSAGRCGGGAGHRVVRMSGEQATGAEGIVDECRLMRTSLLWIQPRLFIGVGVRLVFRLQESTYLRQLSQLHMDSNLGLLLLHGKIIKSTLRQIHPHVDTLSESVTITNFIQRCILSMLSLFLYAFIDDSDNRLLPNNVMMIRNYGGDKEGLK
jgi:hypothetical protein